MPRLVGSPQKKTFQSKLMMSSYVAYKNYFEKTIYTIIARA